MLGVQCHKALYLNRFHPELKNELTDEKRHIFETGHNVGKFAQTLFPGGVEVDIQLFENMQDVVSYTETLISKGTEIIYEAGFQFDEVLVLTDILVKGREGWKIYEVKSSTELKPQYLLDVAVQYYIAKNAGLPIQDLFLVYVNNQYTRSGGIDASAFFSVESVLERVREIQEYVEKTIPELKNVLQLRAIPQIDIGEYCHDPYECDFTGYCWNHIPQNSIFELTGLGKNRKFELYRSGILTLDMVPDSYPLNDTQRLQVESFKTHTSYIDRESIREFLEKIRDPIHFLDFETFIPAIPLYDRSRPYQHIPFQYSLYIKKGEHADLEHFEYLGMPECDPRREFIEGLLSSVEREGDILVYNKAFEITRLKELMQDFPEYTVQIQSMIERIKDLMLPFRNRLYYTPSMGGSYSLKAVLPALVADLDYSDLEISGGISAMYAYEQLFHETDMNRIRETRQFLLEYCKRDTLAMVRIFEVLERV